MRKATLFLLLAALALFAASCSEKPAPFAPPEALGPLGLITIPNGAVIDSAIFYIWVREAGGNLVEVHRITADWDEATITWNSFNGAYTADIFGTFDASSTGWKSVNITTLVQGWVDGTYPNYGLVLIQNSYPWADYFSKDAPGSYPHPYLKVCYTAPGGSNCETTEPTDDSWIWSGNPDANAGFGEDLGAGWTFGTPTYKMAMLKFELLTPPPQEGCTFTIGYWKNHSGYGKGNQGDEITQFLPIWLGNSGGGSSLQVTTALIAYRVLSMNYYGNEYNGITKLYAQLLGAKLDIASGADDIDVAAIITAADAFLATHSYLNWANLSESDQQMVLDWMEDLDDYNNGLIGPGHCEE